MRHGPRHGRGARELGSIMNQRVDAETMRPYLRLLLLSALLLTVALCAGSAAAESDAEDAEASGQVEAYGYVSDVSNPAGNIALPNVEVSLYDSEKTLVSTTNTDYAGRFVFSCAKDTTYYLTFALEGYAVRNVNLPSSGSEESDGMYGFVVTDALADSEGRYALTGTATSSHAVAMAVTKGIIYGTVSGVDDRGETFSVRGARVTATSAEGKSTSATTDADGYFEMEVDYGSYTVKVTCTGFHDSEQIETSTSSSTAISVTLSEKEMSLGLFGDLDAPHSLLVIGMIVLAIVLILSFLAFKRSQRPDSGISIVDELQDDDEIRNP